MTSFSRMCCHSWQDSQEPFFNKIILGYTTRLFPTHYHPSLACSIFRFVTSWAYLGSIEPLWDLGRQVGQPISLANLVGAFTTTVERDFSEHHTERFCLNACSHRIVHLRKKGSNKELKLTFMCTFFCNKWPFFFHFLISLLSNFLTYMKVVITSLKFLLIFMTFSWAQVLMVMSV